jgi:hypothetical protein
LSSELHAAHQHCRENRGELAASTWCGCFHCGRLYAPAEIVDWIDPAPPMAAEQDRVGQTALCPHCGIDAVIGDAAGYPLAPEFLEAMRSQWF